MSLLGKMPIFEPLSAATEPLLVIRYPCRIVGEVWFRRRRGPNAESEFARSRLNVIEDYGGHCACCGETRTEFLSVDHVDGGGGILRRAVLYPNAGSRVFYDWVIGDGFPDNIRVLCCNCNMSVGFSGYSPHDRERIIAH